MGTRAVDRESLRAFLGKGASFGRPEAEVCRIVTHAAEIFLVDDRAFKMKRAVTYSFLDFSTLDKRHQALEAELRLNRRTAPALYHRVIPVTQAGDGTLMLDGPGEPVEWLLEMERFDQEALLDRIAQRGELDPATIETLASALASFHQAAERRTYMGGLAAMTEVVEGNGVDLASLVGPVLEADAVTRLMDATRTLLQRQGGVLEQRRLEGLVRHCHGDLHLGNIVLIDGEPVLFDALEFDEALATTDTVYDLAFLLMDLIHRDLGSLGQRLLNGYLEATWDDGGTALLPLFLSIRAAIRAKVTGLGAAGQPTAALRNTEITHARSYLDLAARFLAPEPPQLVAIGGLSGTGKSTLGRALAPRLSAAPGAILLRSDVIRKTMLGVAPADRLNADAYTEAISIRVYETMHSRAEKLLACGQAVIVDAVYLDREHRAQIERIASELGAPFQGFWLEAPAAILMTRVSGREGDASDATVAVVRDQLEADPGAMTWCRLDAGAGPKPLAAQASDVLARKRAEPA